MAKLPNKNFITYLSNYGQGGSSQFDEYVALAARQCNIEPFEICLARQEHYRDAIKHVIDSYQSTVVLLSGRAGDGKTHFLRKLFTDPHFIGHSLEEWENSPNCFSVTTDTTNGPITFTLVKDFTSNDPQKTTAQLRASIIEIMEQNATPHHATATAPAPASSIANAAATIANAAIPTPANGNTAPTAASCHIVIIAGNSGKIMERFQNLFALNPQNASAPEHSTDKSRSGKSKAGKACASGAATTASVEPSSATLSEPPQRLQQFIHALELYMLEANASKLKNFLGVQCHDMSACLGTTEIKAIFTTMMQSPYWDNCSSCPHHDFCPIVRNRQILMQPLVLQRLLQLHELMVDNGLHFTVRNVFLLFTNALLGCNTKDKALSCDKVNYNISRHTTQFHSTNPQDLDRALMQFNLASLPFDNFFGLNASAHKLINGSSHKTAADDQLTPIFIDLQTMGVGQESTKLVDELLCTGHSSAAAPLLQRAYQGLVVPQDHYALTADLQRAYTHLQANLGEDDEQEQEQSAGSSGRAADSMSMTKESHTLQQMRDLMASLRRILFFTLPLPATESQSPWHADTTASPALSTTTPLFNPYLLTAYPHALQYLKLKHEVQVNALARLPAELLEEYEMLAKQMGKCECAMPDLDQAQEQEQVQDPAPLLKLIPHDYCPVEISTNIDTARTLIIGLNRAFMGMMLLKHSAEEVFITTRNQLNPSAQSIIYDIEHYRIDVDFRGRKQDTCMRFECSPNNLITLVFHQSAHDFAFTQGQSARRVSAVAAALAEPEFSDKNSRLVLTPQLFEYLMSLAAGHVGNSGNSIFTSCHHNLMAFKDSIDAMLSQTLNYDKRPSDLLNNVFVCQLDEAGDFAL